MSRLFLLETLPSGLHLSPRDTVVALTPQAAYALDQAGIPYRIPSDFGAEERLRRAEPAFLAETRSWLSRLDSLLQDSFPYFRAGGLRPAVLYAYHWKTLLDNLFTRGLEIDTLLEGRPEEVLFAAEREPLRRPDRFLSFSLDPGGLRAQWARHLCSLRSIPLRTLEGNPFSPEAAPAGRPSLPGRIRRQLLQKSWWTQGILPGARHPARRLTLLFLEADYLAYLLKQSLRAGHRCLAADASWLPKVSAAGASAWTCSADALSAAGSPVWNWPGRWFDVPLSIPLGRCLKSWISQDLRVLSASLPAIAARYNALKIDFVLAPFLTEPIHFSAVAACRSSKATQSVMIADGDGPEEGPAWDLIQLSQTEHYFVPDEEFAGRFQKQNRSIGWTTARVHIGGDRWKTYGRLAEKPRLYLQRWENPWSFRWRRPPLPLPDSRPVVLLPLAKPEPDIRRLHRFDYDETWYYRLLKGWIDLLAEETRYLFVIKPILAPGAGESTVERIVRGKRKSHLLISRSPFPLWLPWANRVVLDHPSTPMYETALAGVPMRLILPATLQLRPEAIGKFESCVDWYEEPREAAEALRRYLDGPHSGTPRVKIHEASTLETLLRIRAEGPSGSLLQTPRGQEVEVAG